MGLFINKDKHPEVYKNLEITNENNQELHRKDYLAELLQIQQNANLSVSQSLDELKLQNQMQKELHSDQWNELNNQLDDLKKREFEQHNLDIQIIERLKNLEEKYKTIYSFMEKETILKREILNDMRIQNRIHQEMTQRIEQFETVTQHLSEQIEKQREHLDEKTEQYEGFQTRVLTSLDNQEKQNQHLSVQLEERSKLDTTLTEKIAQQESYQSEILTKIDKQEALTEKLARQINHIRSILFERSNFLADKIEDGYKLTSSYVYKLLTGAEQPITFYTFKNKQEDQQKQTE
ncbi:MAG: hypothetical protein Q8929_00345 [Bacillota bacterium]|nr:hypothetical protein [Bacillota bacterium]